VKHGESINRYVIKECGIQKHGETPRRISFMFWLKNYWVEERKVTEYTSIIPEALKRTGNSTFKQWAMTETETFFRLTQREMTLRKVPKETKRFNSCNTCTRPAAINNGNNNDGQSITLLYTIYRMASLTVHSPTRAF